VETPELTAGAGAGKQVIPHVGDHVIVVVQQDIPPFLKFEKCFVVSYHVRVGLARKF
jgi:hypothetical protein